MHDLRNQTFLSMLKKTGAEVLAGEHDTESFSHDKSYIGPRRPIAVAVPRNSGQVSRIMKLCNSGKVSVTAMGGGSSLTGSSIPSRNGIVISMERLNKIIEVNIEDGFAVVEPGVTIAVLNKRLERYGYFYPPDPASARMATIGGSISTNAGGLKALMFGSTKNWVLDIELVLASGKVVRTGGSTLKMSRGYDITSLVVGSEGTLGIITLAVIRIIKKPESSGIIASYYTSIKAVADTVGELKRRGMPLIMAEFMDHSSLSELMRVRKKRADSEARYMLLTAIASGSGNDSALRTCMQIIRKHTKLKWEYFGTKKEIERVYNARRELHEVMVEEARAEGLDIVIGDVIVPPSRLAETLSAMENEIKRSGERVALFGHIGDGNIHSNVYFVPGSTNSIGKVMELQERLGLIALKNGGSVSAEHGIGIEKKKLLIEELRSRKSIELLGIMKDIKNTFDPNGILNRGKIFD